MKKLLALLGALALMLVLCTALPGSFAEDSDGTEIATPSTPTPAPEKPEETETPAPENPDEPTPTPDVPGSDDECDHADASWRTFKFIEDVVSTTETTHTYTYYRQEVYYCPTCTYILEEGEVLEEGTETENHYFRDGKCTLDLCGVANTCKHGETEVYGSWRNREYVYLDEQTHILKYDRYEVTVCQICGETVSEGLAEEGCEEIIDHYFYDGVCNCGYVNPCEHGGATYTYHEPFGFEDTVVNNGSTHSYTAKEMYYSLWCDICDEELEWWMETNVKVTNEPHEFDDGECWICGAKEQPVIDPSVWTDDTETEKPKKKPAAPAAVVTEVEEKETEEAPQEMVTALFAAFEQTLKADAEAQIEIVGAKEIMTEEEYAKLTALTAQEQLLVTLQSIGMGDAVEAALKAMKVELSEDAQALVGEIAERMAAMSEEEVAALQEKLAENFPVETVEENGETYEYFVIELQITSGEDVTVQRYGFRYDEKLAQWVFVQLEAVEAEEAAA